MQFRLPEAEITHAALARHPKVGERRANAALRKFGEESLVNLACANDPIFFMRHFFKVRSTPDSAPEEDDAADEADVLDLASTVELLDLWPKQEELVTALLDDKWVIGPKSRKIGFTTVGIGFGCWVQTFYPSTRCHYISYNDRAGMNMIARHRFGWQNLPRYMRLARKQDAAHIFSVVGPDGDERIVQNYAATENTAIEEAADFTILDEFASVRESIAVPLWSGLLPSIGNGYLLVISRGRGPQGMFARLVKQAERLQRELHGVQQIH